MKLPDYKLCGHQGTRCPVGLGISSRILRVNQALFVLSRILAVTYALLDIFGSILPVFQHFLPDFGYFWTDFKLFLSVLISRFWINRSGVNCDSYD